MEEEKFTFLGKWFGVGHEQMHVATAGLITAFLTLTAILLYPRLKKSAEAVFPDNKISFRSFIEMLMDLIVSICDDIIGHDGRKYVPFIGSIFFFIFFCNLIGLIPGFVPATENWVTGAAVATIVFLGFNYFGFREHGIKYFKHFLAPISVSGIKNVVLFGIILVPLILFQCLFGAIEIISMTLRPFTLSIRLYVNIVSDHAVSGIFAKLVPLFVPIPLMLLGLLVCFLQAFIFTLLTVVYISLSTAHDH